MTPSLWSQNCLVFVPPQCMCRYTPLLLSGDVKLNERAFLTYKDYDGATIQISSLVSFQLSKLRNWKCIYVLSLLQAEWKEMMRLLKYMNPTNDTVELHIIGTYELTVLHSIAHVTCHRQGDEYSRCCQSNDATSSEECFYNTPINSQNNAWWCWCNCYSSCDRFCTNLSHVLITVSGATINAPTKPIRKMSTQPRVQRGGHVHRERRFHIGNMAQVLYQPFTCWWWCLVQPSCPWRSQARR